MAKAIKKVMKSCSWEEVDKNSQCDEADGMKREADSKTRNITAVCYS